MLRIFQYPVPILHNFQYQIHMLPSFQGRMQWKKKNCHQMMVWRAPLCDIPSG